jgi:ABC-type uncharacterized transport system auxiliary subunit
LSIVAALLGGCISVGLDGGDEPTSIRFHTLPLSPQPTPPRGAVTWDGVLCVRGFAARGRYEARVVERAEGDTLRFLEYERWGDEAAESVGIAVRRALEQNGPFRGVVGSTGHLDSQWELRGEVLEYDLVRTTTGPYRARFQASFELSDRRSGALVSARTLMAERDLPGRSAQGLGSAMSAAIADVAIRLATEWRGAPPGR